MNGEMLSLSIKSIRPYPNNPRTITDEDVERVAESIEKYGYQSPIIVDEKNVIVVGHARFLALKKLGHVRVNVLRTDLEPEKVAQYRLIDNRSAELATWDPSLLIPELREFTDDAQVARLFPEIDLSVNFDRETKVISDEDIQDAALELNRRLVDNRELNTRSVTCPNCGGTFEVSG